MQKFYGIILKSCGGESLLKLYEDLKKEKKKLDEMIANSDGNLTNEYILEQSKNVDKLIVAYQKLKQKRIRSKTGNIKIRSVKINV